MARSINDAGVVPLTVDHRTIFAIVAVAADSLKVPPRIQDRGGAPHPVQIFVVNELKIFDSFAENLTRSPSEDPFSRTRPPNDAGIRSPLDHREWRVFHVEPQALRGRTKFSRR